MSADSPFAYYSLFWHRVDDPYRYLVVVPLSDLKDQRWLVAQKLVMARRYRQRH